MSTPAQAAPSGPTPPRDDSRVSSIAWAVATIVVALCVAFIAWLAMHDGGSDAAPPTPSQSDAAAAASGSAPASPSQSSPAPTTDDQAQQTVPAEVQQLMLDLQRREADDPMAVGEVDAPVVMIEYADYRCPFCAKFALETRPQLQDLVDDGTLRIEFRDLVLFDEPSRLAAIAARAAAEQAKGEQMQAALFGLSREGHGDVDRDIVLGLAKKVGVEDLGAFRKALSDKKIAAAVDADTQEARELGLSSTPTFLVNTSLMQGAQPVEDVRRVIEAELAKAQAKG